MSNLTPGQRSQLLHDMHTFCVNPHTREIFLHSHIDSETEEEPGVEYRSAITLEKNLSILHKLNDKPIIIHMHSPGGDWNDGMAIYDTIKCSKCHVTILAYAHASSMSSIILQAADLRLLLPNTEILIHYGEISLNTTSIGAKSFMKVHQQNNAMMLEIYTSKCKDGHFFQDCDKTESQIKQFLHIHMQRAQDWYLTPPEAVKYGFADHVIGGDKYPTIASCTE